MIARLSGTVADILPHSLIVEVGGVGYEVFATDRALGSAKEGERVTLYTHYYLRENAAELYGFFDKEERAMFEVLLTVSGIGPKAALTILNAAPISMLQQAIAQEDASILTKVSGVGTKKAQKIIIELKDKFADVLVSLPGGISIEAEVMEALESIGYSRQQIQAVMRELPESLASVEEKIHAALKMLGKK